MVSTPNYQKLVLHTPEKWFETLHAAKAQLPSCHPKMAFPSNWNSLFSIVSFYLRRKKSRLASMLVYTTYHVAPSRAVPSPTSRERLDSTHEPTADAIRKRPLPETIDSRIDLSYSGMSGLTIGASCCMSRVICDGWKKAAYADWGALAHLHLSSWNLDATQVTYTSRDREGAKLVF